MKKLLALFLFAASCATTASAQLTVNYDKFKDITTVSSQLTSIRENDETLKTSVALIHTFTGEKKSKLAETDNVVLTITLNSSLDSISDLKSMNGKELIFLLDNKERISIPMPIIKANAFDGERQIRWWFGNQIKFRDVKRILAAKSVEARWVVFSEFSVRPAIISSFWEFFEYFEK